MRPGHQQLESGARRIQRHAIPCGILRILTSAGAAEFVLCGHEWLLAAIQNSDAKKEATGGATKLLRNYYRPTTSLLRLILK